ncbi:Oxidoreductase, short-chain dehydrogenase/reductase family [hydrothermal vent metagenome]|uniref:Oxidoreductase, short-chain dehydrogenase/reductase family n=1 Tax=hydrothermal vent metagenome TaxID=652676 RepID=A0A3B1B3U7_9ZZZZ
MKKILIIGATSAIAQEVAKIYALEQCTLYLVGRNEDRLHIVADDLRARCAQAVEILACDLSDPTMHRHLIESAQSYLQEIDVALIAYGSLPDQPVCESSVEQTLLELNTNFISVVALLTLLANVFEKQGSGNIAVISSVAGDRGRQSNYVYGAAKGGLSIFLGGLRNRLSSKGVNVLTIKPGFVDTPMTADFKKGLLWVSAESLAKNIVKAIDKKRGVAYLPWFWWPIMLIIKSIPERVFKKLKL